jgi:hypothetical protein
MQLPNPKGPLKEFPIYTYGFFYFSADLLAGIRARWNGVLYLGSISKTRLVVWYIA